MTNSFHLIVAVPDSEPIAYVISGELIKLGRSPENDIQILVQEISISHAEFYQTENGYQIADLGSTNGTTVNDLSVKNGRVALHNHDYLILGDMIPAYFVVAEEGESVDIKAVIDEIDESRLAEKVAEPEPEIAVKTLARPGSVKKLPALKPPGVTPVSKEETGRKTIKLANTGSPPARKLPAPAKTVAAPGKIASPVVKKLASSAARKLASPGETPAMKKIALPSKSAGKGPKLGKPVKKTTPKLNLPKKDDH